MNTTQLTRDRVLAAVAANPSMTRRQARRLTFWLTSGSILISLTAFALAGGMTRREPLSGTIRLADGAMMIGAAMTCFTLGRGRWSLQRAGPTLAFIPVLAPVASLAWMRVFATLYGELDGRAPWTCLILALIMAGVPFTAFLSMKSGSHPQHPRTLGAAAGAMCASWANLLIILLGSGTRWLEALVGSALPSALLVLAGAVAGPLTLGRWRSLGRRHP